VLERFSLLESVGKKKIERWESKGKLKKGETWKIPKV